MLTHHMPWVRSNVIWIQTRKKLFLNQMIWEVFMMKVLRNGMSSLMDGDEGGSLCLVYDSECSYKSWNFEIVGVHYNYYFFFTNLMFSTFISSNIFSNSFSHLFLWSSYEDIGTFNCIPWVFEILHFSFFIILSLD